MNFVNPSRWRVYNWKVHVSPMDNYMLLAQELVLETIYTFWLQKERQRTLFTRKRWSRVAYSIYTLHKFRNIKTFVYKKALQVQVA